MRVAAGAICRQFLAHFGVALGGYITQIGNVIADVAENPDHLALFEIAEANEVRCPVADVVDQMREEIRQAKIDKDTLGGIFTVFALNVPPGLGTHVHWDRKLDGRIVGAMVSIHAMKGAEIGPAFVNAGKRGSEVHDMIDLSDNDGALVRRTNRAGGLEGGITTGDPIVVNVAMKPISTMLRGADSVNLATGEAETTTYERSDFCATPRAVPVGEAMLAIVLADALAEKLGGDSIEEMKPRFEALRQSKLSDLPMDNVTWRFGYE
jgi:chorismate synthase